MEKTVLDEAVMGSVITEFDESSKKLSNEEILEIKIEDLELSLRSYNALKRSGVNKVKDLMKPKPDDWMGVRNLGKKSLEEVLEKIQSLGFDFEKENKEPTKQYPGHEKCEKLREIRKKIAIANNIKFKPAICTHNGPCKGTCPVCDSEIRYLDRELQKKKERGEEIKLQGIAEDDIKQSQLDVFVDEDVVVMGMPVAEGGLDFQLEDIRGKVNDEW